MYSCAFFFLFWLFGMVLIWYFYIKPYFTGILNEAKTPSDKTKDDEGEKNWNSKVFDKENLSDQRLPVTVVTGYL